MAHTSDDTPGSVVNKSEREEPKADNKAISKRLKAAQRLVQEDVEDGFCMGSEDDVDAKFTYLTESEALLGGIDDLLDDLTRDEGDGGRQAA